MSKKWHAWLLEQLVTFLSQTFALLVARVKWSKGEWKTSTWRILSEYLQEDAQALRAASPSGVAMYAMSFGLMVEYLLEYRAGREIRELRVQAANDLDRFVNLRAVMKQGNPTCYTEGEERLIEDAVATIKIQLAKLECYRPA